MRPNGTLKPSTLSGFARALAIKKPEQKTVISSATKSLFIVLSFLKLWLTISSFAPHIGQITVEIMVYLGKQGVISTSLPENSDLSSIPWIPAYAGMTYG
jgi:hypothetical protein